MGKAKRERAVAPAPEYVHPPQLGEHEITDAFGRKVNYRLMNSPFPNRATRRAHGIRLPLDVVTEYGRLLIEAEEMRQQAEGVVGA